MALASGGPTATLAGADNDEQQEKDTNNNNNNNNKTSVETVNSSAAMGAIVTRTNLQIRDARPKNNGKSLSNHSDGGGEREILNNASPASLPGKGFLRRLHMAM